MLESARVRAKYVCGPASRLVGLFTSAILLAPPALATIVPRSAPGVGQVVAANGGEEIHFIDATSWQEVDIAQDLLPGDVLRTGPYGLLAILFRDETQIRLHHNSIMQVKEIGARGSSIGSLLRLEVGSIWSRAKPVANGLEIETPAATAAIRGTDWALSVASDGATTLTVLSGRVEFFNDQGRVTVERGEQATARIGQAPTKRYIIDPQDKPRWALYLDLEWIQMLSISGKRLTELRARRASQDRAQMEQSADAAALLEAAAAAYDLGDLEEADRLQRLASPHGDPELIARQQLLQGFIALRRRGYDEAVSRFALSSTYARGRTAMLAKLGQMGVALETKNPVAAERHLADAERTFPDAPETVLGRAWFLSFGGAHEEALHVTHAAANRYPHEASLQFLQAHLYQLTGKTEIERQSLQHALELDPDYYLAWNWLGLYYTADSPDAAKALDAYNHSIAINPFYHASWNNRGNVELALGDLAAAEADYKRAIAAEPLMALPRANYGLFLMTVERSREAEPIIAEAYRLDPSDPYVLQALGILALMRGQPEKAIEWMLKAVTVDPAIPGGNTNLAVSFYQAGRVSDAWRELDAARRLDPNDPLPSLIGSVIAQDRAEAGKAVRLAQEGFDKYERSGYFNVEGFSSSKGGLFNLGSAYGNLGLQDWGAFYADLSASPYIANSYFALANTYPSASARAGAVSQGLLLDPTAVSAPTRYYQFIREPEIDPTVGGTVGSNDGGLIWSTDAGVQGFSRFGSALAYNVQFKHLDDSGARSNSDENTTSLAADAGYRLDEQNSFLLRTFLQQSDSGIPGPTTFPQDDDKQDERLAVASLGYQHRFNFNNRIIAQATYNHSEQKYQNRDPFGSGSASALDFSLVNALGLRATRQLYAAGLYDATQTFGSTANNPIYTVGAFAFLFGPQAFSELPPNLSDTNPLSSAKSDSDSLMFQGRHLFDFETVSATYGGEWMRQFNDTRADTYYNQVGTLNIAAIDAGGGVTPFRFPFAEPSLNSGHSDQDIQKGQAYTQAAWHLSSDVTVEGGVFFRHYENGFDNSSNHVDPRAGASWQLTRNQWLRIAYQQDQNLGLSNGTLAPVTTVGLVAPDAFAEATPLTESLQPSRTADLSLRWDAQWNSNLYTFLQAEYQTFDDTVVFVPGALYGLSLPRGERMALSAGSNVWFLERFGAFGTLTVQDSEAHVSGPGSDPNMPLLPGYIGRMGFTWVHPWQIRFTLAESFVGERASNIDPHDDLDSYRTTDFTASWQPLDKHVLASVSALNLFDDDYELAAGYPAPGRTFLFGLTYRF